ncbi:MAG: DNA polymerase III subunit alpha [bacterium]|nr:DNA polymerase III subunit alpha [bacterium]
MYIIFDTETTGLPRDWNAPITDTDNWPRVIQIAWQLHDDMGNMIEHQDFLIRPEGFDIPFDAEQIHGISTELAKEQGEPLEEVLELFNEALGKAKFVVGQNIQFDINVTGCEFVRTEMDTPMLEMDILDTCTETTANLCQIPGGRGGKFKLPTLTELHEYLFNVPFAEAHNATADVEATTRCFFELMRRGVFLPEELHQEERYIEDFKAFNPAPIGTYGLKHQNLKEESAKYKVDVAPAEISGKEKDEALSILADYSFAHLHNHSQFSILQSTIQVNDLVAKAAEFNMRAVALTDTGNMMAAFHFERAVANHNQAVAAKRAEAEEKGESFEGQEIMPIIGCEFNVCRDLHDKSVKDNGYQVVFLAKNKKGYHNLIKLASIAYTEGMYYVPRIDKNAVQQYKEDLMVLTGNLYGEVPSLILNVGETQAEEALVWWKEQFGADLYVELMRHGQENEDRVNETLIRLAEKHEVKLVATNNTYYIEKEDAEAHDVLLCVKDNELVSTPKGRGRGFRYGLENDEYYFKSQEEMKRLFLDVPEAIQNIDEIIDKCEHYGLARDVLLPAFEIPEEFQDERDKEDGGKRGENNYLRHLTYEGAKKRYGEITDEIRERLDFELATVERTGYPGYFLIVQDFCQAARDMGVSVGPGRGSAAGSAVAYCTGITNVDPIHYDLLFERFLNPDRISMPDIDIDFDDEGRGRVIDWVIEKYGSNQVAQIITYGTMAAKSSIRDTARVLDLPLSDADRIAKLIPDISLSKLFGMSEPELREKLKNNQDDINRANELRAMAQGSDLSAKVINRARQLEGSVRNTGIHACGVIITPDDITKFVPVALAKDSDMYCTQYDNSVAEDAGLLKMDFLGLKTLTLIKHAVRNVKDRHGIELVPDDFPIDDENTYKLFQRGETVGIFQYESAGMQKYMRELKPTVFADLIAMNALYRPGPLEYIPSFIRRAHGEEEIVYDLDACEEYLQETYGITVYQEQVMLLSQKLAGFSKGEADTLRKAMGKKKKDVLDKMKPTFLERGGENGHDTEKLEKIWKDWEAFASYAFNKSHSTCYAWIAYQTAYLKSNYPAEYMASVLSNNMNDIKQVSFFMEECRRMGVPVLGPDINESNYHFTVNKEGAIRFGLGAIKGLGSAPVQAIIEERTENGWFKDIFDLTKRINLRVCNRKAFESLVYAGGFDSFKNVHRAQYFKEDGSQRTFLENVVRFGSGFQDSENSSQASLFGEDSGAKLPEPVIPPAEEWGNIYALNKEKEVIGMFISGHPLDDFQLEIDSFCNGTVGMLNDMEAHRNKDLLIAGIISEAEHRFTKKGDPFGTLIIEDYNDSYKLFLWRENYLKYKHFLNPGTFIALKGRIEVPPRRSELEFSVHSIDLLQTLRETKANSVQLKVSTKALDQRMITDLNKLFMENTGNTPVKFVVYDPLDNVEVSMPSKTMKVGLNNELVNGLKDFDLEFKIK